MKLADLGELGLLAELERRGLAKGIADDAALLEGGLVVTQDALVEGVHFTFDRISWRGPRVPGRGGQPLRPRRERRHARRPARRVSARPATTRLESVLELYEGIAETGVDVIGGDTTAADRVYLSVTALGRSERVPGRAGARPGDVLVVTGPLGGAGAAFRQGALARPPIRLEEGRVARRARTRVDRHLRRHRARRRPHRRAARAAASSSISIAFPALTARPSTTSASARTTSCSLRS